MNNKMRGRFGLWLSWCGTSIGRSEILLPLTESWRMLTNDAAVAGTCRHERKSVSLGLKLSKLRDDFRSRREVAPHVLVRISVGRHSLSSGWLVGTAVQGQPLRRNVRPCREGLVSKAHRLWHDSALGPTVMKKKKRGPGVGPSRCCCGS